MNFAKLNWAIRQSWTHFGIQSLDFKILNCHNRIFGCSLIQHTNVEHQENQFDESNFLSNHLKFKILKFKFFKGTESAQHNAPVNHEAAEKESTTTFVGNIEI